MMADAQTDYLNDYWTNCKTATRNLSRDWLTCYDLLFKSYGNFKPTCKFFKSKHFLRTVNSSLHMLKCGVMFTGQTHLSKGNFPFNLKNNTEITITIFNLTSRTGVFFELSSLVFCFSSFKQAEVSETRDRVGSIFFTLHTTRVSISTRARLVLA